MTDYTKLDAYPKLNLIKGSGASYEQGFCVMQAVAWFAGEAHLEQPECACPVLAGYAINLNDCLPSLRRQALRALIAPLTSTRSKEHERKRAEYIVSRVAREIVAPLFDKRFPQHTALIRAARSVSELQAVLWGLWEILSDPSTDFPYGAGVAMNAAGAAQSILKYEAYPSAAKIAVEAGAYAVAATKSYTFKTRRRYLMIDILRGAIALGPNGGEDLTPFAERIHELHARGYVDAAMAVPD
jgi:hypothetical protein